MVKTRNNPPPTPRKAPARKASKANKEKLPVEEEPEVQKSVESGEDDNWEKQPAANDGEKPADKPADNSAKSADKPAKQSSNASKKPSDDKAKEKASDASKHAKDDDEERTIINITDDEGKSAKIAKGLAQVLQPLRDLLRCNIVKLFKGEGSGVLWFNNTWTLFTKSKFSEAEKRTFVYHSLDTEPQSRFLTYLNGRQVEDLSENEIRTFFETEYHSEMSDVGLDNVLENFTFLPADTPSSFLKRFHALYVNKPHINNDAKKRDLRRVLPKPMKTVAMNLWSTFKTLKDAQDWVTDNIYNYVKAPNAVNVLDTVMHEAQPESLNHVINAVTRAVTNKLRSNFNKSKNQKFAGKCFNCKKRAGHKASDCPEPKRNDKPKRDADRFKDMLGNSSNTNRSEN